MQPSEAAALAHTLSDTRTSAARVDAFDSERDAEAMIGTRLHHFRVLRPLGAGGMGAVYVALDESLEREVALKVLHPEYASETSLRERFVREARAQAGLHNPYVVHLYYIGQAADQLFFAMELVEGPPLDKFIEDRKSPLSASEALDAMECTALALREAHARGFVHRDIKPGNLLRAPDGSVKLADFGLARPIASDSKITLSGMVIGSPAYMSPEQALGGEVDHRSDMYSLGATFFHLITGRPPYEGPTPIATITKHVTEPLPGSDAFSDCPPPVVKLLQRMLAKKQDDRFASYDDLLAAITAARPQKVTYAGLPTRVAVSFVDYFTYVLLAAVLGPWVLPVFAAYVVIALTLRGQTLGDLCFRVQVTREDGTPLRAWHALIRHVVCHWFTLVVALQYFMVDGLAGVQRYLTQALPLPGHGHGPPVMGHQMMMVGAALLWNAVLFSIYAVGFLMAAFDRRNRALHDRAAGTVVTYRL